MLVGPLSESMVNAFDQPRQKMTRPYATNWNSRNRQSHQSLERSPEVRPVGVAGLHPPRPAHQRRTQAPDRRRRPSRHDLESRHLRKGDRRQHAVLRRSCSRCARKPDLDAKGRYEILAIRDIQDAADILRPVYDSSKRRDGYVSLEVSPYLARDTQGTLDEARRLWKTVGRENVMIKVPGTTEGIPAFQQLISEGININVTLLFSQEVYRRRSPKPTSLASNSSRQAAATSAKWPAWPASSSAASTARWMRGHRTRSRPPKMHANKSN